MEKSERLAKSIVGIFVPLGNYKVRKSCGLTNYYIQLELFKKYEIHKWVNYFKKKTDVNLVHVYFVVPVRFQLGSRISMTTSTTEDNFAGCFEF